MGRWFSVFHEDVFIVVVIVYERWLGQRIKGFAKVPLITIRVMKMLSVTIENPFMPSSLIYPFSYLLLFPLLIINPIKYTGPAFLIRRTDLMLGVIFTGFSTLPLPQRLHSNLGLMLDCPLLKEFISCFSDILTIDHFSFREICSRGSTCEEPDGAAFSSSSTIFSPQSSQPLSTPFPLLLHCFVSLICSGDGKRASNSLNQSTG